MSMEMKKHGSKDIVVGFGDLYVCLASEFKVGETTRETMTNLGYIHEDGATFKRSTEVTPISSANRGVVDYSYSKYTTEFDAKMISLSKDHFTTYTTGSDVTELENGCYRILGCESDRPKKLALCFSGTDEDTGAVFDLYMPSVSWVPELELAFNGTDPIALNMHFNCANVELPNGKYGSYYLETNIGVDATEA